MTPAMGSLVAAVGALWIAVIMWDAFEAIVLPRRVTRRLRPARLFYRVTWRGWGAGARPPPPGGPRGGLPPPFCPPSFSLPAPPPGARPVSPPPRGGAGGAARPPGRGAAP